MLYVYKFVVWTIILKYCYRIGYFAVTDVAPVCFGLMFVKVYSCSISHSYEEEIHVRLCIGIPHLAVLIDFRKTEL